MKRIPLVSYPPSSRFCKSVEKYLMGKGRKEPCTHKKGECLFAHSWQELLFPNSYNRIGLTAETSGDERELSVHHWDPNIGEPVLELPPGAFYPTKITTLWKEEPNLYAKICYDWLFQGKCSQWANCQFAHPDLKVYRKIARTRFCRMSDTPPQCRYLSVCPYAHDVSSIQFPDECRPTTCDVNERMEIRTETGLCMVSRCEVLNTKGYRDGRKELCSIKFCDQWSDCLYIHLTAQGMRKVPNHSKAPSKAWGTFAWGKSEPTPSTSGNKTATPAAEDASSGALLNVHLFDISDYLTCPPLQLRYGKLRSLARFDMKQKWRGSSRRFDAPLSAMVEDGYFETVRRDGQDPLYLYHPNVKLGEGGTSEVYLALKYDDGMEIALKRLHKEIIVKDDSDECEHQSEQETEAQPKEDSSQDTDVKGVFSNEIEKLKTRNSIAGIVRYFGSCELEIPDPTKPYRKTIERYVALELMECSLTELVEMWGSKNMLGQPAHILACQYIIGSVLRTLDDLRRGEEALLHRDIKPDNILIDKLKQVKLIDFGIAKEMHIGKSFMQTTSISKQLRGTIAYAPPERDPTRQVAQTHITSDLYSLGLVLYYILTGRVDWFSGMQACERDSPVQKKESILFKWAHRKEAAHHLIRNLVTKEPNKRAFYKPDHSERKRCHENLLRHPFFWSDRHATSFLIALGNMRLQANKDDLDALSEVITQIIASKGKSYWHQLIHAELWSAHRARWETKKERDHPLMLLRFIRNCYAHSRDDHHASRIFLDEPYFLLEMPTLVIHLWDVCRQREGLQSHPLLRPYLLSVYHPSLSFPFPEENWF